MTPTEQQLHSTLRTRYQADYQPVCSGCGQLMRCIMLRVFRCDGELKVGRRWRKCPAPEQWTRPNERTRREMLAVLDQLELAVQGRWPRRQQARIEERPRDLFSALGVEVGA